MTIWRAHSALTPVRRFVISAAPIIAVTGLLVAGCGGTDADDEATTAFKLATIDGESPTSNSDAIVGTYQRALDAAVAVCEQGPDPDGETPGAGDLAVSMSKRQPEQWTVLSALEGMAEAVPAENAPMDCVEVSAALLTLADQ